MTLSRNAVLVVLTSLLFHVEAGATKESTQRLDGRAAFYGGFALAIPSLGTCPSSTYSCNAESTGGTVQGGPCCPPSTVCDTNGVFCCPTSADCSDAVFQSPTCAEPSWTLYTVTETDFICCPSGTVADEAANCVPPGIIGVSSQDPEWTTIGQGNNAVPTGNGSASTMTAASAATTSSSAVSGSAPTSTSSESTLSSSPSATAPAPGSSSPTTAGGSSPTSAAVSPSATQKSAADRSFMIGRSALALVGLLPAISLLL